MYSRGRAKISNLFYRFLHEFIGVTPAINLKVFCRKVSTLLLLHESPLKYTILYLRMAK